MKQRVTSLDLKLLVSELKKYIKGHRLQNIYNLVNNSKSFLLKFSIPDSKHSVVLENGMKIYMTDFQRPTQPEPSFFTSKLRKYLKTRRLTNIKQIGDDRIVVMEFSDGLYYLVLEFFSAGNIILLDTDCKVVSLFRSVHLEGNYEQGQYNIGGNYAMFDKTLFDKDDSLNVKDDIIEDGTILEWLKNTKQEEKERKKVLSIEKLCFSQQSYLSSDLIHINLLKNGVDPRTSCLELLKDEELLHNTVDSLNGTIDTYNDLMETPVGETKGYILSKKNPLFDDSAEPSPENLEYIFDEFHPYEPTHKTGNNANIKIQSIIGYNKTVDNFFTTLEMSKVSLSRQTKEANIQKRLQFVKDEHAKKLEALNDVQELNFKKGYLINVYNEQIEQCKEAVQKLINQKMDWKTIEKLIDIEKKRGNEIAKMIKSLNLIKNEITITLVDIDDVDNDEEEDEANETDDDEWTDSEDESDNDSELEKSAESKGKKIHGTVDVIIDITQSAFANSSRYFDAKKTAQQKQEKTAKSSALAIKSSEKKITQDLKKIEKESKQNVEFKQLRPKYWFEKFFWFISSEGYLCIAGRDDSQVDTIYYKYFDNETDFLVSNDHENALKVFIKNPYKNKDVSPTTFMQAGIFSLSSTKAWENKLVSSPWYVAGKNVSKNDFDGTILPSGLLNVARERNYLPPCQMVMGAGLLFVGDEDTFKKYKEIKIAYEKELELACIDRGEGYINKIKELKNMLEVLVEQEKKYENENENEKDGNDVENSDDDNDADRIDDNEPVTAPTPQQQTQTKIRGKKNKLKKIREKYGEQDEEERRLRMAVLGTLKQVEQNNKTKEPISSNKDVNDRINAAEKKSKKRQLKINQITKLISELENKTDDIPENDEEAYAKSLSSLEDYHLNVGNLLPLPNKTDKVVDCIAIFAPWGALNKYAYKIKLQPGNLKKGKTTTEVIEAFKRHTAELKKEGSDWYDQGNLIELINQQDFMLNLTASKFKVGSSSGSNNKSGSKQKSSGKSKNKKK